MKHILSSALALILLICGSACSSTKIATPTPTPTLPSLGTDLKAQISTDLKAQLRVKLDVARYELQLYEDELKATKEEIRQAETGKGPSPSLLEWKNKLKDKVIQTKVKIREFEILVNEKHQSALLRK